MQDARCGQKARSPIFARQSQPLKAPPPTPLKKTLPSTPPTKTLPPTPLTKTHSNTVSEGDATPVRCTRTKKPIPPRKPPVEAWPTLKGRDDEDAEFAGRRVDSQEDVTAGSVSALLSKNAGGNGDNPEEAPSVSPRPAGRRKGNYPMVMVGLENSPLFKKQRGHDGSGSAKPHFLKEQHQSSSPGAPSPPPRPPKGRNF